MSYQVLASKWRPKTFGEMVGQKHVLRALVNAIQNDRIHHAFLFTGTRGVGKTTVARIFAKALNCETGVTSEPCGQCSACQEIDQGHFVDLIEVDAASRTRVEDTRELLDNVQYTPTRGRYKIYLIDEVHMLSTHSFNALLKTLEEPPPHVKFLLATTDPQKLPVTILSRCLQFNLKSLPIDQIHEQLIRILKSEKIKYEEPALKAIARAADGSLRDALSLLDQAIAYTNKFIGLDEVNEMLGTIEQGYLYDVLAALGANDADKVMQVFAKVAERSPDYLLMLDDLITLLHKLALAQMVPDAVDEWYENRDQLMKLAGMFDAEQVQLFYQIALTGKRDLPLTPSPKNGFEMLLLRMLAFSPVAGRQVVTGGGAQPAQKQSAGSVRSAGSDSIPAESAASVTSQAEVDSPATGTAVSRAIPDNPSDLVEYWAGLISAMKLAGTVKQLAANSVLTEIDDERVVLTLGSNLQQICTENARQRLQDGLNRVLDKKRKLDIRFGQVATMSPSELSRKQQQDRHQDAVDAVKQDAVVKELQNVFDAQVMPELISPNDPTDA